MHEWMRDAVIKGLTPNIGIPHSQFRITQRSHDTGKVLPDLDDEMHYILRAELPPCKGNGDSPPLM